MSERRVINIQMAIPRGEVEQFEQLREDLGLTKAIDVLRAGLEALHFLVEETKNGAEVFGHRPDGTRGTYMIRCLERVRRKAVNQKD